MWHKIEKPLRENSEEQDGHRDTRETKIEITEEETVEREEDRADAKSRIIEG
jgi:hypothetical protein